MPVNSMMFRQLIGGAGPFDSPRKPAQEELVGYVVVEALFIDIVVIMN